MMRRGLTKTVMNSANLALTPFIPKIRKIQILAKNVTYITILPKIISFNYIMPFLLESTFHPN